MLADTHTVLAQISGGTDVTLNEITVLMNEFNRHISDGTRIHFGMTTDAKLGRRLCVTILSSLGGEAASTKAGPARHSAPIPKPAPASRDESPEPPIQPAFDLNDEPEPFDELEEPEPVTQPSAKVARQPVPSPKTGKVSAVPAKKEVKAEQMPLEPASRGRFEKAEPTIVDGQDLDVPTFMRKNLKVR
jgi:cell division protein FtsZ